MRVRDTMTKLNDRVERILIVDEASRNDNDRLYNLVIESVAKEKGVCLSDHSITVFLTNRKVWGFPTYEATTRARRKVQENNPMLRADANVEAMRELNEEEYRQWAVTT